MTDFIEEYLAGAAKDDLRNVVIELQSEVHELQQRMLNVNQLDDISPDSGTMSLGGFWYGTGDPNNPDVDTTGVGASSPGVTIGSVEYAFYVLQAGDLMVGAGMDGSFAALSGTIGGWTIDSASIASASFVLDSSIPAMFIGAATAYLTGAGVFEGKDVSDNLYKFRVGDPAGDYMAYDGSGLLAGGIWLNGTNIDFFNIPTINGVTWTANSPSGGSVAWSAFSLTYQGTTYTVSAGNTANKFIWWKKATSTTVLQTGAAVPAAAADQFLVAINSSGTPLPSLFQNVIYADYISVTNLAAINANMGALTIDGKLTMNGASGAIAIGTTPPTTASAGTGLWIDRTGVYSLSANVQNATLTSAGLSAGANAVTLDVNGATFAAALSDVFVQGTNSINWKYGANVVMGLEAVYEPNNNQVAGQLSVLGNSAKKQAILNLVATSYAGGAASLIQLQSSGVSMSGTLDITGYLHVNTNKFTVAAATGNTLIAGSLEVGDLLTVDATGIAATGYITASGAIRADTVLRAGNDIAGIANYVTITNATQGVSSGTGTVKMNGTTSRNSAGWVKEYAGTTAIYIPYWTAVTG